MSAVLRIFLILFGIEQIPLRLLVLHHCLGYWLRHLQNKDLRQFRHQDLDHRPLHLRPRHPHPLLLLIILAPCPARTCTERLRHYVRVLEHPGYLHLRGSQQGAFHLLEQRRRLPLLVLRRLPPLLPCQSRQSRHLLHLLEQILPHQKGLFQREWPMSSTRATGDEQRLIMYPGHRHWLRIRQGQGRLRVPLWPI